MKNFTYLPSIKELSPKPLRLKSDGTIAYITLRKAGTYTRFKRAIRSFVDLMFAPIP